VAGAGAVVASVDTCVFWNRPTTGSFGMLKDMVHDAVFAVNWDTCAHAPFTRMNGTISETGTEHGYASATMAVILALVFTLMLSSLPIGVNPEGGRGAFPVTFSTITLAFDVLFDFSTMKKPAFGTLMFSGIFADILYLEFSTNC
jgi:hypothetical protein